jgi:hypothetical protein
MVRRHIAPELVFKASNAPGYSGRILECCEAAMHATQALMLSLGQVKRQRETVV